MGRAQQGSYSLLDLGPFIPNLGGERVGALVAASFGILAVYYSVRTGSLLFIIGAHASFDRSISFFYSAPIAGLPAQAHLLNPVLSGPARLTGGHAGPAGSVVLLAIFSREGWSIRFDFPALGAWLLLLMLNRQWRRRKHFLFQLRWGLKIADNPNFVGKRRWAR